MAANQALVAKLYRGVIEDVINGVREAFLDEGIDEAVLLELKQNWENKLQSSKAIDPVTDPAEASLQNKLQQRSSLPTKTGQQTSSAANATNATSQPAASSQAKQPATTPTPATTTAAGGATAAVAATATTPAVRMVPVQITVPPQPGVTGHTAAKSITVHVPAHALQGGAAGAQLQTILSSPAVTAALSLPVEMATTVLQQHINNALQTTAGRSQSRADNGGVTQLDGPGDSSDDEDDVDDDDDDDVEEEDDHDDEEIDADNDENADEEPLNSEDDVTDDDPSVLFETDNVVVCQYDKITRSRNRWKFHLKDGIMNINGRDYVFQKANGDAEW
ncbi:transcription initiation factor IIA subunit 1 isoform X1 [Daphnia magna]|uniref:Transcription initiation factor IIA subunit n=1 Tax=Daphnia magna TaxID=35525 RepID=A0A0P6G6N8_9CRUS|nr:transcription initiation factor IIA subunit 1 isoform X1 [Daphnia magna]